MIVTNRLSGSDWTDADDERPRRSWWMKGVNDLTSSRPYGNELRHLDVLMYISSLRAGQITYVRACWYIRVRDHSSSLHLADDFHSLRVVSSLGQLVVCMTVLALWDRLNVHWGYFIVVESGFIIMIVFHCCGIMSNLLSCFIVVESGVIIIILFHCFRIMSDDCWIVSLLWSQEW